MLTANAAAAGGDTLISSAVQQYKSLSPRFRKRLDGLTAIHSNNDGATQETKNNGADAVMRRKILQQEHPIVIVHPVTKEKALYVVCIRKKHRRTRVLNYSRTRSTQRKLLGMIKKSLTVYSTSFSIILQSEQISNVVLGTNLELC